MKETVIQKHSAMRRESSRSLEVDASTSSSSSSTSSPSSSSSFTYTSIPRRASTTSLKTVKSLDQSPIKEEEGEKSLSLKRSLTRKLSFFFEAESSSSSGWNGLGSLSTLKSLGALGLSPGKKQTTGENHDPEEDESDTLKKRLSRRLSSLFDSNSEAVLQSPSSSPIPDTCDIRELRSAKRRDLPICWLENLTALSSSSSSRGNPSLDLLTRLASRVYTRHLAREILQHLSKQVTQRTTKNPIID